MKTKTVQAPPPWAPTTICRRCKSAITAANHTLADCEAQQQAEAKRVAADLAYNQDKAHRLNNEAFVAAMQAQINDKTGAFA
jgi:ribosomal protein L9